MHTREQPRDRALAALAARQHGVVGYGQLRELGIGRDAIKYRAAAGRLHRIHRGVYAVGHKAISRRGHLMAAVLTCGPCAVLSHCGAAWLWELQRSSGSAIHVTVPGQSRGRGAGITVHRTRHLPTADRTIHEGIPVTTVARTLLDLAEMLRPRQLARAVEEAERLRLFDLSQVEERGRGRQGVRALKTVLAEVSPVAEPTRSELERRFLALCRRENLPPPGVNVFVAGFEVDVLWPEQRVAVELDGYAFHGDRAAFERDRARDAALQAAGYRVLRFTYRRLETEPALVAHIMRSLLC